MHPDVVACTLKRFEEELEKALATRSQGDADLRRQAGEIERGIANQLRALRDGYSPAITADLAKLEPQLASVKARLETSDPRTVKLQIRDTRRFVESRLEDLSALWDGEPRIAREEIAKHVGKITLKPMLRVYIATGVWDWLGVLGTSAAMVVPGARIELATPAFSGRRSTTELPRHLLLQNCIGLPPFSQFSTPTYLEFLLEENPAGWHRCWPRPRAASAAGSGRTTAGGRRAAARDR